VELLVRPLRRGAQEPYRHVVDFLTLFPHLRLMSIDPVVAQEAASLRAAHNLSTPDALIIGTGMVAQVGHLVSNDARWARVLHPFARRISVCELSRHLPFP
jgi:predicted nucleic acid-binding protein